MNASSGGLFIIAVAHDAFRALSLDRLDAMYNGGEKVLIDVKSILDRGLLESREYRYWRL